MDQQILTDASPASSLLCQGQTLLSENHVSKGLECFETAVRLDPYNAKLFYAQGLSLFEWGSKKNEKKALLLACKKLKTAIDLAPNFFESWQAWGSVLLALGFMTEEHHYFLQASNKFSKALELISNSSHPDLLELYWDHGLVFAKIAEHSKEPSDLYQALKAFEKAASFSGLPADFWEDFGAAYLNLSNYSAGTLPLSKAIDCLQRGLALNPYLPHAWGLLGEAFKRLYFLTQEKDHLDQADTSFQAAVSHAPENAFLSTSWTRLLLDFLYEDFNLRRLCSCIAECERIAYVYPRNPLVLALLNEAYCLLGAQTEDVNLLDKASKALEELFDTDEELHPQVFLSYGQSLHSFYEYFEDVDYLYQAIEQFQQATSTDRTSHANWYQMGKTYTLLGSLHDDQSELELGVRFLRKAAELHFDVRYLIRLATCLFKLGDMLHSETHLRESVFIFGQVFAFQKQALYIHPELVYSYASALDALGNFDDEEDLYLKAIDLLSNLLLIHPSFHATHHRLALSFAHLGELSENTDYFSRAISHYRTASKHDPDNDSIFLDWAVTLVNLSEYTNDEAERHLLYKDAEHKLLSSAKLGNVYSYYHLSGLYSLMKQPETAMIFLKKAREQDVLPPIEELLEDDWLDNLRMTRDFQKFLLHLDR